MINQVRQLLVEQRPEELLLQLAQVISPLSPLSLNVFKNFKSI